MEAQQREQKCLESPDVDRPKFDKNPGKYPKKLLKNINLHLSIEKEDKKLKKKQKVYCVCQTPYDKSK